MREVGERYRVLHEALQRGNFDLAIYHWDKIKITIQDGYTKRPARKANADMILLDTAWKEVRTSLESRDAKKAWGGFAQARSACMACHAAESVPYFNKQSLFELVVPE